MPESANRRLHFLYLSTSGYICFYLYYKYLQNSKTLLYEFSWTVVNPIICLYDKDKTISPKKRQK